MGEDQELYVGGNLRGYYDDDCVYDTRKQFVGRYFSDGYVRDRSNNLVGRCQQGVIRHDDEIVGYFNGYNVTNSRGYVAHGEGGRALGAAAAALLLVILD